MQRASLCWPKIPRRSGDCSRLSREGSGSLTICFSVELPGIKPVAEIALTCRDVESNDAKALEMTGTNCGDGEGVDGINTHQHSRKLCQPANFPFFSASGPAEPPPSVPIAQITGRVPRKRCTR